MKRIDVPSKLTNWSEKSRNRLRDCKSYFCKHWANRDDMPCFLSNFKIFEDLTERRNCMVISQNFIDATLDYVIDISTTTDVMIDRIFHYLTTDDTLTSGIMSNIFNHDAYIRLLKSSETLANMYVNKSYLQYTNEKLNDYIRSNIMAMRLELVLNLIKEYVEKVIPDDVRDTEEGDILLNADLHDIMHVTPWYNVI